MKSCCFFGHRNIWGQSDGLRPLLEEIIEDLVVKEDVRTFYFGEYGQFDSLCYKVVSGLKVRYPHIQRVYVLAYYRHADEEAKEIASTYDETLYPPLETVPLRFAISRRNQKIVEMSDVGIFYVNYDWGGAWKTLQHAKQKKKPIINLGKLI